MMTMQEVGFRQNAAAYVPVPRDVGARPEQVDDDTIKLEVPKQIRILELAAEELKDELLGFHLARNFDLREIGLVYYVIASWQVCERETVPLSGIETSRETAQIKADGALFFLLSQT
jgi:hypothetical protein